MIDGAVGHLDGEKPRMVRTPWSDEEIPFTQAAEIGTRKVIADHSTVGVVMTSDGSIATELPRSAYVAAEERAVGELKGLGKPFVVVLNSTVPGSNETMKLAESLSEKYGACVVPMDVLNLSEEDIRKLFENLLMEFPLRMIDVRLTKWLRALPADNKIIASLNDKLAEVSAKMSKMSDYAMALRTASFSKRRSLKKSSWGRAKSFARCGRKKAYSMRRSVKSAVWKSMTSSL